VNRRLVSRPGQTPGWAAQGATLSPRSVWHSGALQLRALPANRMVLMSDDARGDTALINRMARGDADPVAELYDRHSRLLFGLILRILNDRSEAEEVLQEVFITVWHKAATYDVSLGSVTGWLVGIARNRAIDRLRTRKSRDQHVAAIEPMTGKAKSPEAGVLELEQQQAVTRALDALPAEQRALIEHAYFDGLSHTQLAARFRLPLGTVKTRIRAGMMALREQLHDNRVWS